MERGAFADKVSIPKFQEERMRAGIARPDLATKAKVSYTTLYRVERGDSVKLSTAQRIAKALGKTVEELQ